MKPTIKQPAKKYKSLEDRFIAYSLGGDQRKGRVITEAKGSNQFDRMTRLIRDGK